MSSLPQSVQRLIDDFAKLPGIGPKSASRIVLHLLNTKKQNVLNFAADLNEIRTLTRFCKICFNLSEEEVCRICNDPKRNEQTIIVVEDVLDLLAFERVGEYSGKYHVLGGAISPLRGIGPEDLNIIPLRSRVKDLKHKVELIIATNPNLEGEATAMYIKNELSKLPLISISRIARGLPSGAELDYADRSTLLGALNGRTTM